MKQKKQKTIIENINRCASLIEACGKTHSDHVATLYGIMATLSRQLNAIMLPFSPQLIAAHKSMRGMPR